MKDNEDFESPSQRNRARQTTFGYNTQELHEIDKILRQFIEIHEVSLASFVSMIARYPFVREQTKLIEQIFKHTELVQDMIAFLLQPHRMLQKYKLSQVEGLRYIRYIAEFTKENRQFYQFLFIALQENSKVSESFDSLSQGEGRKEVIDPQKICLDQWFNFLEDRTINKDQHKASLGYITQVFIPFVIYQFSASSRIYDYFEIKYKKQCSSCLIFHFHKELVKKLIKYSHYEPIFKCLFKLVLVSLEEQQWKFSLNLLHKLCQSAVITMSKLNSQHSIITFQQTSDQHIQNICNMVKEVADNITKDRNRTVFAFVSAIIKSQIVKGVINRLKRLYTQRQQFSHMQKWDFQWTIQLNIKTEAQIVKIYYLLLKSKVNKNANLMNELRNVVTLIAKNVGDLINLIKSVKVDDINFSNGQSFKATPFFKYQFFNLIRYLLLVQEDHGEYDLQMKLDHYYPQLLALIQTSLSQNRWNSINHSLIEKIIGMIITTQFFKTKHECLNNFLEFLMEAFTNKTYVFLNSTRMAHQGDIQSLYNICRKIAASFQKACLSFGLNNQYEQWSSFVRYVLQGYQKAVYSRTSSIQSETDLFLDQHQSNQAFSVEIDEIATVKQIVKRIQTKQIWIKSCNSSKNLFRSISEENLLELPKTKTQIQSTNPKTQQQKATKSLVTQFQLDRKLSNSTGNIKQQYEYYEKKSEESDRLSGILAIEKHTSVIIEGESQPKSLQQVKQFAFQAEKGPLSEKKLFLI